MTHRRKDRVQTSSKLGHARGPRRSAKTSEEGDTILFVCVENAGRSQMAEAFARKLGLRAASAGTVPARRLNPVVVELMKEKGIDLSSKEPKMLTLGLINQASLVVTVGCSVKDVCPRPMLAKMRKKLVDWHLEAPKGKPVNEVRGIRDEMERRVSELAASTGQSRPEP